MFDKSKLKVWACRQLFVARDEGPLVRLVLKHLQSDKRQGGEIFSTKVPKEADDAWVDSTINELEQAAHVDAGGIGGVQSYTILAYYRDSTAAGSRFPFKHASDNDDGDEEAASEPANKTGSLAQQMRHNELIMRTAMMGTGQIITQQAHMLERMEGMVSNLINDKMESLTAIQEALDLRHERDMAMKKEDHKMKLQGDMIEKVGLLGPALVNKIVGAPMLPAANPMVIGLKNLMNSITEEQFAVIMGTLAPEQQIALASAFQAIKEGEKNGASSTETKPS